MTWSETVDEKVTPNIEQHYLMNLLREWIQEWEKWAFLGWLSLKNMAVGCLTQLTVLFAENWRDSDCVLCQCSGLTLNAPHSQVCQEQKHKYLPKINRPIDVGLTEPDYGSNPVA